ncbi:M20 metallopeptidase family protein [Acidaminobacter hydrogenoformans]|uniref:Amidohydrolase n=1 Tax=Acidaminobacter hydrogenoformans DSM 2784 TaxID=1120920 RepID=A0A1G5S234_9FIRM|nr:amidohydrolase [Acidaminobacter hydrogenoformans]SCZ80373.1 amidohydrolase [Acidaminobacter hydrogenoformans DSM 2784]
MIKVKDLKQYETDMITWRRDFHMHPEKGFDEVRTSGIVADLLESWGLEVVKNFCMTAVIGILDTKKPGKVIGIRADMDALSMQDQKDVSYRSINAGLCHSCGHDGHTSILLGIAKYLSEHQEGLTGKVKFVFQPAEEGPPPGGAKLIMQNGILDDVDIMIGSHIHPSYKTGKIIVKYDEMLASGDFFDVIITGKGGHGAYPHECNDVISTALLVITALNNIISREIDTVKPGVLSVCNIQAGEAKANNVIPQSISFGGTFRTLDEGVREHIIDKIDKILKNICSMNNCTYEFNNQFMFPILRNSNEVVEIVKNVAIDTIGSDNVEVMENVDMGCEDFAYYSTKIPSCYFYFGVRNEAKNCTATFHHPDFNMDEDSMIIVQAVIINTLLKLIE